MAVTAPEVERVESLRMTSECAKAEKPSPPYSFGMIMAKNLWRLRKSHTSGGRSHSSKVICQSLSMWHSSLTGPSRNACSSAVSRDREQLRPVRIAGEQVGVPPHVAGLDRLALGVGERGQHMARPAEDRLG